MCGCASSTTPYRTWGPPKPRNAVLLEMLVRHMWPRTACAGKQYTPSECIKARSITADDRSQLLPAIQIRIGGIEGIFSTRVCLVVSNCVKFCHSHRGHGVFGNIIVLWRTSIVVVIHVIGSDRAIIGETDTILGKEMMPSTLFLIPNCRFPRITTLYPLCEP